VKYREEIEALSFIMGVILIPVGLFLWLSQQPAWDADLGEVLYMLGFSSFGGTWLLSTKRTKIAVVILIVLGVALCLIGSGLNEISQTHGYQPILLLGLGLLLGLSFALESSTRVDSAIREIREKF